MKILTILVHGLIGSYINAENQKVKGLELEDIVAQAKANPDFDEVHVKINSSGGNAQAGFDIYHYLKSLGKPITTMVEGRCESIATVIALAGDKRTITPDSVFMIHNPWAQPTGDADEIAAAAKELKAVEDQIINFYHEHTGIEKTALDALMKKETEMNPTIAVSTKFMTEMTNKIEACAYAPKAGSLNVVAVKTNPFKKFIAQMEAMMKGDTTIFAQKNVTWTLADGTQIIIDTEDGTPAVGNEVTKGGQPLGDGAHKLLDGGSMTIAGGKISVLTPKEEPADTPPADTPPADPAAAAAIAALEAKNKVLEAGMANMTQAQNAGNVGLVTVMKQLEIIGASIKSDYKPEQETILNSSSENGKSDSANCVTGIKDREKEYKGYKKPEGE